MSYLNGMDPITNDDSYIDMRDVACRIQTLENWAKGDEDSDDNNGLALIKRYAEGTPYDDLPWGEGNALDEDEIDELLALRTLENEVSALDGTLIRESAFDDYAQEFADDIYGLDGTGASAYFDYEKFTAEYQQDFTQIEWDGVTYYHR